MTQFEQLKHFYTQFFNLANEIKSMIDAEEYNEAISKVLHKEPLVNQFLAVRKALTLSDEEQKQAESIEKELMEKEKNNIDRLMNLQGDLVTELKKTKHNLKVNNAYTVNPGQQGSMLDFSE